MLVYLESSEGNLDSSAYSVATASQKAVSAGFSSSATALILSAEDGGSAAAEAAKLGFTEVVEVVNPRFSRVFADDFEAVVVEVMKERDFVQLLLGASNHGKDIAPRVTAALDGAQASDVIEFLSSDVVKRPMYAGDLLAEIQLLSEYKVATIRGAAFD